MPLCTLISLKNEYKTEKQRRIVQWNCNVPMHYCSV